MRSSTFKETDACTITIIYEPFGTTEGFASPQFVSEAMQNVHAVDLARRWVSWRDNFTAETDEPVEVFIRKQRDTILIRWYTAPHADPESARIRLHEILRGDWEAIAP